MRIKHDQDKEGGVRCGWPGQVRHQIEMGHEVNAWMEGGAFI